MLTFDPYARKSSADRGKSVSDQLAEMVDDLTEEGLEIGETFADKESSASRFRRSDPKDFARLMTKIESGKCQGIVLWESSRGSRDPEVWFPLLGACRRNGTLIRITSHDRTYDVRRRVDWKILAEEGVASADESELKSERVLRGKRMAAKKGTPAGALLFGHARVYAESGHYVETVLHTVNAPVAREVFERIAKSEPVNTIARELDGRKAPAPGRYGDGTWRPYIIRQMIRNPAYAGLRVHQGNVVGRAAWPAVVTEDLWRRANAVLDDPDRRTARSTELQYLLGGAARCGHPDCPGRPAVTAKKGRRARAAQPGRLIARGRDRQAKRRYACEVCGKSSIVAEEMDAFVERLVRGRLTRPDARSLFEPGVNNLELHAAKDRVADLERQLNELAQHLAARRISGDLAGATEAILRPQLAEAEARKRALEAPAPLGWLRDIDVAGTWDSLGIRLQREIVRKIADVVVSPAIPGIGGWTPWRLAESRWIGDERSWGDHWREKGLTEDLIDTGSTVAPERC